MKVSVRYLVVVVATHVATTVGLSIPSKQWERLESQQTLLKAFRHQSDCEGEGGRFPAPQGSKAITFDRRTALSSLTAAASSALVFSSPLSAFATPGIPSPNPMYITTLVLNKGESAGVQLNDVELCLGSITTKYATVQSVSPDGAAAGANVKPGMILLGNYPDGSKSVVGRIKEGPFPVVLQFYNLAGEEAFEGSKSAEEALTLAQDLTTKLKSQPPAKEPQVSAKGTGLVVKTVTKGSCANKANKGDVLTLKYEARVASPGGPIYDSGTGELVLGKQSVVKGVELGLQGMCLGEVRELDVPSVLGYGKYGSGEFDVPGDVRLWWTVELLRLNGVEK